MKSFNPALLKLVREQRGISQSMLKKDLNLPQAKISKLETGELRPTKDLQEKLAAYFDYPETFFYQSSMPFVSGMVHHRKRSSLGAKERDMLEAEVKLRAFDIVRLYKMDNRKTDMIPRENRTPEELAIAVRKHWNLKKGPLLNLVEEFEKHNIAIIAFDFQTEKLDAFLVPVSSELACIALNTNPVFSPDRQRMSLAHEYAHFLMHQEAIQSKETEEEANRFAAELLAPKTDIIDDLRPPLTLSRLRELKIKWHLSMYALTYRAKAIGAITEKSYTNLMIYLSARGYRKGEPSFGIEHEKPTLIDSLMEIFVENTPNALNELHLTSTRFHERYPSIKWEGQSMMTPTVS